MIIKTQEKGLDLSPIPQLLSSWHQAKQVTLCPPRLYFSTWKRDTISVPPTFWLLGTSGKIKNVLWNQPPLSRRVTCAGMGSPKEGHTWLIPEGSCPLSSHAIHGHQHQVGSTRHLYPFYRRRKRLREAAEITQRWQLASGPCLPTHQALGTPGPCPAHCLPVRPPHFTVLDLEALGTL